MCRSIENIENEKSWENHCRSDKVLSARIISLKHCYICKTVIEFNMSYVDSWITLCYITVSSLKYRVSGLQVYKNTCFCFSTWKLYDIYFFNSVQSNSKIFLCTSVHFNVGTFCSSTDICAEMACVQEKSSRSGWFETTYHWSSGWQKPKHVAVFY